MKIMLNVGKPDLSRLKIKYLTYLLIQIASSERLKKYMVSLF